MTNESSDFEERLTPATIHGIACDVRDGTADPEDVKRILLYYVRIIQRGEDVPAELRDFLKSAFDSYLQNKASSVDQALGLIRPRQGRTKADENEQMLLAAQVLAARIDGKSHQDALEDVAEDFECGKTKVGEAWKKQKGQAYHLLRYLRMISGEGPFTESEERKLSKIYKKDRDILRKFFADQPPTITSEN